LQSDLTPAFGSFGQNVTADRCDDLFAFLLERTFPRYLLT
jgi:hypothetical protein